MSQVGEKDEEREGEDENDDDGDGGDPFDERTKASLLIRTARLE